MKTGFIGYGSMARVISSHWAGEHEVFIRAIGISSDRTDIGQACAVALMEPVGMIE